MFCRKCGYEMQDSMAFCPKCGTEVIDVEAATGSDETEALESGAELEEAKAPASETGLGETEAIAQAPDLEKTEVLTPVTSSEETEAATPETGLGEVTEELPVQMGASGVPGQVAAGSASSQAGEDPQGTGASLEGLDVEVGVSGAGQMQTAPASQTPQLAVGPAPEGQPGSPGQGKGKRTAIIVAIVVVVLIIVGIIAGVVWNQEQERKAAEEAARIAAQEEWDRQHQTYKTLITLVAPELDDSGTPVPVQVTGTDFEGNEVTVYHGITASDNSVELMRGDYKVAVVGSPVNSQGRIYSYDTQEVSFVVDESGGHLPDQQAQEGQDEGGDEAQSEEASSGSEQGSGVAEQAETNPQPIATFEFELIEPEDVTDEQIDSAYKALQQIGYSQEDATKVCDTVRKSRQDRLDQIAAEKAEAERKAAEEAARRANPASVDGSSSPVTLKGTVVREEWPTSQTQMAWSAIGYFLVLDEPVQITFAGFGGQKTMTATTDRIHISSVEQYDKNANNFDGQGDPQWDSLEGQFVAINGKLINTGNAHVLAAARFDGPHVEEVF